MLYISFGSEKKLVEDYPDIIVDIDIWFKYKFKPSWLEGDFVKDMVKNIDNSDIVSPYCIESPIFGQISPDRLSRGVKALIVILNTDFIVWAGSMDDNCFPYIIEMSKFKDVHLGIGHTIYFDGYNLIWEHRELYSDEEREKLKSQLPKDMEAIIINTGEHIYTVDEYFDCYMRCRSDKDFQWLSTQEKEEQDKYISEMIRLGIDEDDW